MQRHPVRKALVACAVGALAMASFGADAFAGEVTGSGKSLKNPDGSLHGASICAFSGLNDTYSGDPTVPDEDGFFRTQSWGQIPKEVRDVIGAEGARPGVACNPTLGESPEP
jgi:hypothetical protein